MATRLDDADARGALRAAMLEWREPLTAIAALPDRLAVEPWYVAAWESTTSENDDDEPVFWLACQRAVDSPDFRRRMEAAELFAVLARVDFALWRELVREFWPRDVQWIDLFETRTALRVGLAVEIFVGVDGIHPLCMYMAIQDELTTSVDYKTTRQLLARRGANEDAGLPFVPVRIDHFMHDDDYSSLMCAVDPVLVDFTTNDQDQALRATQLKMDPATHSVNQAALESIESLRAAGIQVTDLPAIVVPTRGSHIPDSAQCLVSILDVDQTIVSSEGVSAGGVEKIVVDRSIQPELMHRVLSSIHKSRSLCMVEFDIEHTEGRYKEQEVEAAQDPVRRQILLGAALALFRRDKPLALLNFRASTLFMKDVEWMEEMLNVSNPMTLLFPDEIDTVGPRVAQCDRALLFDPHDKKNAARQQTWTSLTPMTLDVVGMSRDGFLPVFLPGWGKAWTLEHKATIATKPGQGISTMMSPSHMCICDMGRSTMESVLRLLQLVGRDIKRVELDNCESTNDPLDSFCTRVLAACPNLEELELSRLELSNFQFLAHAFRTNRCQALQKLTFWDIQLRERDAVETLLQWIESPRDRMAVQLRKLRLAPRDTVDSSIPEATLRMLSANSRLRDMMLVLRVDSGLRAEYEARFAPLSESVVSEPLPPRCIRAFFSVAAARGRPTNRLMGQFDSRILSLILAFAAARRTRSVTFTAMEY